MLTQQERDQLLVETHENTASLRKDIDDLKKRVSWLESVTRYAMGVAATIGGGMALIGHKLVDKITWGGGA